MMCHRCQHQIPEGSPLCPNCGCWLWTYGAAAPGHVLYNGDLVDLDIKQVTDAVQQVTDRAVELTDKHNQAATRLDTLTTAHNAVTLRLAKVTDSVKWRLHGLLALNGVTLALLLFHVHI